MSDSDSDSDYDPTKDQEQDKDSDDGVSNSGDPGEVLKDISFSRKRKANDLWEELVAMDKAETKERMKKSQILAPEGSSQNTKGKRKRTKATSVLAGIFGKSEAASIMNSAPSSSKNKTMTDADLKVVIQKSVKLIQKSEKIEETRKFAGQSITIERTVKAGATNKQVNSSALSSLDKALAAIKGPETVSTVAKSSSDWDNFKEKEGLEDELSVAQKEGYLTKKDFLNRVDYRKFEMERDERLREQAKRGTTGGGGGL